MHGQRCPVFLYRPGLAVYPSGGLHWVCWVPTFQKYTPVGPTIRHHSCPSEAMNNTLQFPGMTTVCSTKKGNVGTSTNCSASCGSQRTVRCGMASCEILGTSITCSGTELSKSLSTSTSWSTICGTGASRSSIGTGTKDSIICSAVCRWIRSCGPRGSTRPVGRNPPGSSSKSWKSYGWGGGVVRNLAVAISGRCALWCNFSARAIATDIRSCRNMERSRRSLLCRAEPVETRSATEPSAGLGIITVTQEGNACLSHTPVVVVVSGASFRCVYIHVT